MNDWTGAQVLEWLGLLGLPDDSVATVRAVFSKEEIEGDDLEELGQNFLAKKLKKQLNSYGQRESPHQHACTSTTAAKPHSTNTDNSSNNTHTP